MKGLITLAIASLLVLSPSNAASAHDFVHDARTALRRAKSTHRVEDLREARRELLSIPDLKNMPRRKHALREVENAITALEANKIVDADKSIDIALKQLEEAAGADKRPRGPRRK